MAKKFSRVVYFLSLLAVLPLGACGSSLPVDASASWKPPLTPLQFSVDQSGHLKVELVGSISTPLGDFGVSISPKGSPANDEYDVVVSVNRQTTTYRIRSKERLRVLICTGPVAVEFESHRADVTVGDGEKFFVNDQTIAAERCGAAPTSRSTTPNTDRICPPAARMDRRLSPTSAIVLHEWTDSVYRVMICQTSAGELYYYGWRSSDGADILIDARRTTTGFRAQNGDTTYEINGDTLYVTNPTFVAPLNRIYG